MNTTTTGGTSMQSERRFAKRTRIEVDVTVASSVQRFDALSRDLSTNGVFIATMRMVPVGTSVRLSIRLPHGTVMAEGAVTRIRRPGEASAPGLGIAFVELSDLDRSLLAHTLAD